MTHARRTGGQEAVWDNAANAYKIDITFSSDEHRAFFVNMTVDGQRWEEVEENSDLPQLGVVPLWANTRFKFAVYASINTLTCNASQCGNYYLDHGAHKVANSLCSSAGCLFVAGRPNHFTVNLDWQLGSQVNVTVARSCDEQPGDGIPTQFYWQQPKYCYEHGYGWNATAETKATDMVIVEQPQGWNGPLTHFDGLTTVEVVHPGIFTVTITVDSDGFPQVNYTTRLSIAPGPSSPGHSSVAVPKVKQASDKTVGQLRAVNVEKQSPLG